ncbi:hypothetical protein [Natrinema longum]|uniref:Uncharacterized protein n=1 Tax=Natrinema longum TaxID=370324 RepID=A0A8A2UDL6_9EURY|nr:hypothetical protein [Natrinema longum]MBZ6495191.1 hypothetical protein [Natrinema longum]QSW86829.1 hypothetical protein J0X27_08465 [Natrinema longum]
MHISIHQKVIASVVGILIVLGMFLFSWLLALLAALVMVPLYVKILTA